MMPQQQAWPMAEAVLELAVRAAAAPDPALAAAGNRTVERLRRPLCVAVVGRVSSGKSTLLNALLGRSVSPTAGGECTKVLYSFRHGMWDYAVAEPRDGSGDVPMDFEGTRLSTTIPLPADRLRRVNVTLPASLLQRVTLLDTPGLASTSVETSAVTARMLEDTSDAAADADALLFCLNSTLKDDEAAAVRTFRAARGGARLTGGTAVGLLTKADQRTPERKTVWKEATESARKMSAAHAELFSEVPPVIGLLAETAASGALREPHARALAALAKEWNPDRSEIALASPELFLELPGPVSREGRGELVALLGTFGIGELLEALRSDVPAHAAALTEVARAASGLDAVTARLEVVLGNRADVLKAASALEDLLGRAQAAGDRTIYGQAQQLLDRAEMFPLRLQEMARQLAGGQVRPPAGMAEEAWLAVTVGLPRSTPAKAAQRAGAWREWSALADTSGRNVARVMVRAWQLATHDNGGTR